jgi:hypothetical protein
VSRAEVQRKMRVTAAVITQRPARRAIPGPDGGLQMGPLVGAEPHRIGLVPVAPLGAAPGQLTQETLATRLARATAAPLVPGQERPMRWGRRGKITPRSRTTGLLRHPHDFTCDGGLRARAATGVVAPASAQVDGPACLLSLIAHNLPLASIARVCAPVRNGPSGNR